MCVPSALLDLIHIFHTHSRSGCRWCGPACQHTAAGVRRTALAAECLRAGFVCPVGSRDARQYIHGNPQRPGPGTQGKLERRVGGMSAYLKAHPLGELVARQLGKKGGTPA